jgi:hypothetical protein
MLRNLEAWLVSEIPEIVGIWEIFRIPGTPR